MAKKKATAKKTTVKKAAKAAAPAAKKVKVVKEPFTKTQLIASLAESTTLAKKDVQNVLNGLTDLIDAHIKKNAAGVFTLPGLLKMKVVRKPATKARKGINPFTGEETVFKAKPARNVVKIMPLKAVKDMAK